MVTRYDFQIRHGHESMDLEPWVEAFETDDGDHVTYDDYSTLEERLVAAEEYIALRDGPPTAPFYEHAERIRQAQRKWEILRDGKL